MEIPVNIAVIGSRNFDDYEFVENIVSAVIADLAEQTNSEVITIVSGGAKGTDLLAERFAKQHSFPMLIFRPDYKSFGKAAPIRRNREILEHSDYVIAFWDGASKGTRYMIENAEKLNIPSKVVMIKI